MTLDFAKEKERMMNERYLENIAARLSNRLTTETLWEVCLKWVEKRENKQDAVKLLEDFIKFEEMSAPFYLHMCREHISVELERSLTPQMTRILAPPIMIVCTSFKKVKSKRLTWCETHNGNGAGDCSIVFKDDLERISIDWKSRGNVWWVVDMRRDVNCTGIKVFRFAGLGDARIAVHASDDMYNSWNEVASSLDPQDGSGEGYSFGEGAGREYRYWKVSVLRNQAGGYNCNTVSRALAFSFSH